MKKIVLAIVVYSSLALSMGWFFKPTITPSKNEQIRLDNEFKLLCKRYTKKSEQYSKRQLENVFFLKAVVYYDKKVEKYCKVKV